MTEDDEERSDLTTKEHVFVAAYIGEAHGNAAQALRLAGYGGRSKETVWKRATRLMQRPAVRAAIADWKAEVKASGIASLEQRLAAQQDRWDRLRAIADARAADPDMKDVPGGPTGYLLHTQKSVRDGNKSVLVDEYTVDVALAAELRALEQHTAKELGQWIERSAADIDFDSLSDAELDAIARGERPRTRTFGAAPETPLLAPGTDPLPD